MRMRPSRIGGKARDIAENSDVASGVEGTTHGRNNNIKRGSVLDILLPVTLSAAAAAAILNIWLMLRIGAIRNAEKIYVGDEDSEPLIRRMRAQANFIESAPFVLILIAGIELAGKGGAWLPYVAGLFIIARVAHAFGMDGGSLKMGRLIGTVATLLTLLGLGVVAALIAARVL